MYGFHNKRIMMKIKSTPIDGLNITGKIVVMKEKVLVPEYRTPQNRFYRATGGFGCQANTLGSAVFATNLFDGDESRYSRGDFEGWLTDEEFERLKDSKEMTWGLIGG